MDDATYRRWDVRLKRSGLRLQLISPILAAMVTLAGLLVGIWQFSKEQNAQRDRQTQLLLQNARHDFNVRKWEKQLDVYMNFTRTVGKIAAGKQSRKQLDEDIKQFLALYWGEMIYFEDEAVRNASKTLRAEIEHYLEGGAKDNTQLKRVAENLILACRESSNKSLPPN